MGRNGYLALGLGSRKCWCWTAGMCRETRCLVCVGVGRSDGRHNGRHKANPSFHAITKISRILGTLAMLMMGINESVKETQYHNSIWKASQKHPTDQVVKEMISLWHYRSMSSERNNNVVHPGTLIVMSERVRFIWASNAARVVMLFSMKSLCNAEPITQDSGETNE